MAAPASWLAGQLKLRPQVGPAYDAPVLKPVHLDDDVRAFPAEVVRETGLGGPPHVREDEWATVRRIEREADWAG